MVSSKDIVLTDLVSKKKTLLRNLLTLSIRSVFNHSDAKDEVRLRHDLLEMLQKNDNAILTREQETGIDAKTQEQDLFNEIAMLLSSIRDNNVATLSRLEKTEKEYEKEKMSLGMGKNLATYVKQNNAIPSYGRRKKNLLNTGLIRRTL